MVRIKYNTDKTWAFLIGFGIAIFPIHNQWLTNLVTKDGEVGFFLPAFGIAVWLWATLAFVVNFWEKLNIGEKRIYIPLIIIVIAIAISGVTADRWIDKLAPLFTGGSLFALYIVARTLGKEIFMPLALGVALASLGVVISAIMNPGSSTGGLLFEGNYDIVVGYVMLGTALFVHRWRWLLAGVSLVAMMLSGSPEAVFVLGILGIVSLWRKDFGKKLVFVAAPLIIIIGVGFSIGWGQELYKFTWDTITLQERHDPKSLEEDVDSVYLSAVGYRLWVIKTELKDLQALGDGYILTGFSKVRNVHNVPLVIVQQLGWPGILAGVAWLWVSIYCLIKSKWKYAWITLLALCVWDHYVWTQMAPVWWALIGVSLGGGLNNDLIFKENKSGYSEEVKARYNRMRNVANE